MAKSKNHTAHNQAKEGYDEFVVDQFNILEKVPVLIYDLMLIEVWNERFPIKAPAEAWATNNGHQLEGRSLPAEFMGWVEHELELGRNPIVKKQVVLTLCADPEVVDRRIHGTITIEYTWTPDLDALALATGEPETPLVGSLQVKLVGAEHLINLDLHSHNSASNPYVTVLCYPKAPWEASPAYSTRLTPETVKQLDSEFSL